MSKKDFCKGYYKGVEDMLDEIVGMFPDADQFYEIADELIKENCECKRCLGRK